MIYEKVTWGSLIEIELSCRILQNFEVYKTETDGVTIILISQMIIHPKCVTLPKIKFKTCKLDF